MTALYMALELRILAELQEQPAQFQTKCLACLLWEQWLTAGCKVLILNTTLFKAYAKCYPDNCTLFVDT